MVLHRRSFYVCKYRERIDGWMDGWIDAHTHIVMHMYIYVSTSVYSGVHTHILVYIRVCSDMYVYVYIYICRYTTDRYVYGIWACTYIGIQLGEMICKDIVVQICRCTHN